MISGSFLKYFTAILLALNGLILSAHSKLEKAQEELKVLESLAHQSNKGLLRLDSWKEKEEWKKRLLDSKEFLPHCKWYCLFFFKSLVLEAL